MFVTEKCEAGDKQVQGLSVQYLCLSWSLEYKYFVDTVWCVPPPGLVYCPMTTLQHQHEQQIVEVGVPTEK